MATVSLKVGGMTCAGCVASVTRVLKAVPGVGEAEVKLDEGRAVVTYDAARVSPNALKTAIEDAGYDVSV